MRNAPDNRACLSLLFTGIRNKIDRWCINMTMHRVDCRARNEPTQEDGAAMNQDNDTRLSNAINSVLAALAIYDEWHDDRDAAIDCAFKVKRLAALVKDNDVDISVLPNRVRQLLLECCHE